MKDFLLNHPIIGRYIQITNLDFPLSNIKDVFNQKDLYFIFGNRIREEYFLEEIENDEWSTHLIFKLNLSNEITGYLRIVSVKDIVEIHGGGLNSTIIKKLALTEAWVLIIQACFDYFKISKINTSCMINNTQGYNFIIGTGFKEVSKELEENRINFELLDSDFRTNKIFQILTRPAGNFQVKN